jgi:outer membrane protein
MKLLLPLLCAACLLAVPATAPAQASQRIAIVDLKKLFDEYYKTKLADAQLKDEAGDLDKQRRGIAEDYQKAAEDYKKALEGANNQAVSADEREKRKKAAETALLKANEIEQTLKSFERSARGNLEEKQRLAREKILKDIQGAVAGKARAGGYNLVLDTAAEGINRTPVLFYHDGKDDLTAAVLAQLNANAPADLPKSDKKDEKK